MKATDVLSGIRLKFKRAWYEINLLKTDIKSFLHSDAYQPAVEFDKKTHRLTVKVKVNKLPDPMWGVRIGEIVHNFRSTLDHIVWELAGRPSPKTSKTQFPIFEYEAGFNGRGTKQFLKGVDTAAIAVIKSEQPFFIRKDGTAEGTAHSPLWHLKELSDVDKHRTLHVIASTLATYKFTFPPLTQPVTKVDIHKHSGGPIEQDTILHSCILHGATDWPFAEQDIKGTFKPEITFEDGTPAPGLWSVFGTLAQSGNRVESIIRRIAKEILKTEL